MAVEMSDEDFEVCVDAALERIPSSLLDRMDNVAILVVEHAPNGDPDLLGLYEGTPLTERDSSYGAVLPDRIIIFRRNLKDYCASRDELVHEIGVTVLHELAHYFGIDDERLEELGYA